MATIKVILEKRRAKFAHPQIVKIRITHKCRYALFSLDLKVLPEQWNEMSEQVVRHPDAERLNNIIQSSKSNIESLINSLERRNKLDSMDVIEVKNYIESVLYPERHEVKEATTRNKKSFGVRFMMFADSKKKSTREIYLHTWRRLVAYVGSEEKLNRMAFEDLTKQWLSNFDLFLAKTSPSKNSRNIHFRNIRAVFNEAIDDEITTFYPFRRFKIRPVATAKRNLKIDDLRTLFNYPCEPHAQKYLDMFKLMFMLIGINSIDLCNLKEITDGRIEYYRAKTNRLYSIKVEPEAMEIIERYRGENYLLNILDHWKNHKDFTLKMNKALKKIGPVKRVGLGGKKEYDPLFPKISTYWARHSWATIASSLDISRDVIGHALGHGNNTVTDIYIDFDQAKVDEANRKVLDWVLYNKK